MARKAANPRNTLRKQTSKAAKTPKAAITAHPNIDFVHRHQQMVKKDSQEMLYHSPKYVFMVAFPAVQADMNEAFRACIRQYSLAYSLWDDDKKHGYVQGLNKPEKHLFIAEAHQAAAYVLKTFMERDIAATQAAVDLKTAQYQHFFP